MFGLTKKQKLIVVTLSCISIIGAVIHIIKVRSSGLAPEPVALLIEKSKKERPVININTAKEEELITLDGIGQSTAKAIIAYREKSGLFLTKEDIQKVKGIGPKKYGQIKDRIRT